MASAADFTKLCDPVLTAEAMREADRRTIEEIGLPGFTLMESAGRAAARRIAQHVGPVAGRTVAIYCGKGNNGGDGLVAARWLHAHGAHVRVILMTDAAAMSDDAAHNLRLLRTLAEHDGEGRLTLTPFESLTQLAAFRPADLHVDALLGTGLTSALREPIRSLVGWLNEQPQPTMALDVPTGIHSDTGAVLGAAIQAERTLTMAAYKAGLLLGDGSEQAGAVEVLEIGIPAFVLEAVRQADGCALRPTDAPIRTVLPKRRHDAYKYSVGLALVVAGSPGMTGAPTMASLAAARAGAGYVQCACQEALQPALAQKLTEVTTIALPASADGDGIDPDGALEALEERLNQAKALLIGPGLGRHPATQQFIRRLLTHTNLPVVLDADGLNALAGHTDLLTEHAQGRWILTPHAGEFQRLAGEAVDLMDRVRIAQTYARRWNSVLVLKGLPSLVAAPDGTAFINATGNPALATAGTGDVLAGMCVGLLAQGLAPTEAAIAALHLGGACADRYAARRDARTMQATDLIDELPHVIHDRFG